MKFHVFHGSVFYPQIAPKSQITNSKKDDHYAVLVFTCCLFYVSRTFLPIGMTRSGWVEVMSGVPAFRSR